MLTAKEIVEKHCESVIGSDACVVRNPEGLYRDILNVAKAAQSTTLQEATGNVELRSSESAESELPKRIWLRTHRADDSKPWWTVMPEAEVDGDTEYIRADLAAARTPSADTVSAPGAAGHVHGRDSFCADCCKLMSWGEWEGLSAQSRFRINAEARANEDAIAALQAENEQLRWDLREARMSADINQRGNVLAMEGLAQQADEAEARLAEVEAAYEGAVRLVHDYHAPVFGEREECTHLFCRQGRELLSQYRKEKVDGNEK